jgi:hypothetical protein
MDIMLPLGAFYLLNFFVVQRLRRAVKRRTRPKRLDPYLSISISIHFTTEPFFPLYYLVHPMAG